MSTVVDLAGKPVKQGRKQSLQDPIVTKILKRAQQRNTKGQVGAIIVVTITPDGMPTQMFHWGDAPDVFASMLGALEITKHSLIGHVIANAETDYIDGSEDV